MANTDYSPERLVTSVRLMLGRRVDGLAVVVSEMDPALIDELAASEVRVVFSGVDTPGHSFTNVKVNTHKGMQRILEHLEASATAGSPLSATTRFWRPSASAGRPFSRARTGSADSSR